MIKITKLIIIIIALGITIFLILKPKPLANYTSFQPQKSSKVKIYLEDSLVLNYKPKISEFLKKEKLTFEYTNLESANMVLAFQEMAGWENFKINQIPDPKAKFKKTAWNAFEINQNKSIFLSSKGKKISQKLAKFLQNSEFESEWTFNAAGDIMLARHVGKKMIEAENWSLPFLKTQNLLSEADITFANLESPFSELGQTLFEGMTFGADPKAVQGLKMAGIDIVSLANNHFGNMGNRGMNFTFQWLAKNQIRYCGAGQNFNQAHSTAILKAKNLKIAFLAYDGTPSTAFGYQAQKNSPGLAAADINQLKNDLAKAKLTSDVVIVSLHSGIEYTPFPNESQIQFAHLAINYGADVVIGHHPHVIQKIEIYHQKPIFYSLGNFVFDQMWSEDTRLGLVVKINFKNRYPWKFQLIPIKIYDFQQPQILSASDGQKILSPIYKISNF